MTLLDAPPPVTDFERDRWGRPLIMQADGTRKPYTRSSSAAKAIEETFNLELWARRNVAFGLAHDRSLVARIVALGGTPSTWDSDAKRAVNKVCEDAARVAQAHKHADIGTAVHLMSERLDRGEDVDGGPYSADLDAYRRAADAMGWIISPTHVECRMVCDELELAGTCDRIVATDDNGYRVADLKTGSTVEYGALGYAAQLAAYARGALYDVAAEVRLPTPEIDTEIGYIIHLPAGIGQCQIYEIDLISGYHAARTARQVRTMTKAAKSWLVPATPPKAAPSPAEIAAEFETTPDEGGTASDEVIDALKVRYGALDAAGSTWFRQVVSEAQRNGTPIHLKDHPTQRRASIVDGLLLAVVGDLGNADELVRAAVATVLDTDAAHHPSVTLGSAVGSLTAAEAVEFTQLIASVIDGDAVAVTSSDGHLRLERAA